MEKLRHGQADIQKSIHEMDTMNTAVKHFRNPSLQQDVTAEVGTEQPKQEIYYCTNCKVGGHGQRFCEYLLQRPNWRVYPCEKWFSGVDRQTYCPLGRKTVDLADEHHFSRHAMYITGRASLEDKLKLAELVPELMPKTWTIVNQQWVGQPPPTTEASDKLPWFVKETDRNWGTSVWCCCKGKGEVDVQDHRIVSDSHSLTAAMWCSSTSRIRFYTV